MSTIDHATARTRGCPPWCAIDAEMHEDWNLHTTEVPFVRAHGKSLLDLPGMSVSVAGEDQMLWDFEAIEAGKTIAETSEFRWAAPVIQVDIPTMKELDGPGVRQLIAALQEGLAIIEADLSSADPLDETNKADRVDGGGCIWEWDGLIRMWTHAGEELEPSTTLAFINETAGPIAFHGGAHAS